jgi:hypothetical protein
MLQEEVDRVTITNALLGKVTILRSEIERLETKPAEAKPAPAAITNQPSITLTGPQQKRLNDLFGLYQAGKVTPQEYHTQRARLLADAEKTSGTNVVAMKPPAPATAPVIVTSNAPPPVKPKGPKRWSGEALLGVDFVMSEVDRELFTARFKVNYAYKKLRNTLDYFFTYGETEDVLSANRMDGSMKTDYDLLKRLYVYNLGGAGYDEIRLIDLRYEEGPGAGVFLIRGTNYVLRAEYGINYQAQFNADNTKTEKFYHRFAEEFTWKPGPKFSFDEKLEFFPTWESWGQYRTRFEANVRYWFGTHLSFVVTVLNQYDTDPAGGISKNDLQIRSSVGVKF